VTDLDDTPARTRRGPQVESSADLDDGRQPPQDLAAEQSVLGGMLLGKDAIAEVLESLRVDGFLPANHQRIYDAILDLYGQGEPESNEGGEAPLGLPRHRGHAVSPSGPGCRRPTHGGGFDAKRCRRRNVWADWRCTSRRSHDVAAPAMHFQKR
jgi:hypothetical protein